MAGIFATTGIAIETLHTMYPDVPETTLLGTLPGLMAGSLAASTGLLLTLVLVVRPLTPARLRLLPGWETGPTLAVAVLGLLALGQALESLAVVVGLGDSPALVLIRRMLEGTVGPDLFGAVVVLGLIAGSAEEIFFRGYMQSRLREHWPPLASVLATSAGSPSCTSTSRSCTSCWPSRWGSTSATSSRSRAARCPRSPATSRTTSSTRCRRRWASRCPGAEANLIAVPIAAAVFVGCVLWVRRAARYAPPLPPA